MSKSAKAYIAITLQAIIIGLSYSIVKVALKSTDPINLLAHRFSLSAISVFIYKLLKPDTIKTNIKAWKDIAPYSLAYPISFFLFQAFGLEHMSSSESGIIYAIGPILTLIIAGIVLKERIGNSKKLFMALSVLGVVYINLMNGVNLVNYSYIGFILIIISAIAFAIYNVSVKKLTENYNTATIVYIMTMTSFVILNLVSVIQYSMKGNIGNYFSPFMNVSFILASLYLGLLSSSITSILSTYALRNLQASTVGLFNNLSTVISILAGTLFLHEKLYYYHYIGIIAILVGTIGYNTINSNVKNKI